MIGSLIHKSYQLVLILCLAMLFACKPGLPSNKNITPAAPSGSLDPSYTGTSSARVDLPIRSDPVILHFIVSRGNSPFKAVLVTPKAQLELIQATDSIDEYRGVDLATPASLELTSDRSWKVELLSPDPRHFPTLQVPGVYTSQGSAVILIQGEFSIAIFSIAHLANLKAWAFGNGVSEPLDFNVEGEYPGRAVLPKNTAWIVVSASEPWSMEVQLPCCKVPAGWK